MALTFENLGQYLAMPEVGPLKACRAHRWYVFRLRQHALSVAEVTGIGSKALGSIVTVGQTLVGTGEENEEEAEEEAAEAKKVAEQEEAALLARGFSNHRLELEAEAGAGAAKTDAFGEKRGWGSGALDATMTPFTGKETYEFGDLTLAACAGTSLSRPARGPCAGRNVGGDGREACF
jgi:hypothetical protein